jgi:hypothetical protein
MSTGAHAVRGVVVCELGGQSRAVCLTLGALAEIETALGVSGMAALQERLATLSAADILAVLAALRRGAGEAVTTADLAREPLTLTEAAHAIVAAFKAAAL